MAALVDSQIAVFDTETTGVDTTNSRIVTAFIGVLDPAGELISKNSWLINPGVEIPDAASAVHGITTDYAQKNGQDPKRGINEIALTLRQISDQKIPLVVFNAPYDLSLLLHEIGRHGLDIEPEYFAVLDPLVIDRALDKYRRGKRTLIDLCQHYQVPLRNAHDAEADALASGLLAQQLLRDYATQLPANFSMLHQEQITWAKQQSESLSEYLIRIGKISADSPLSGAWPVK